MYVSNTPLAPQRIINRFVRSVYENKDLFNTITIDVDLFDIIESNFFHEIQNNYSASYKF